MDKARQLWEEYAERDALWSISTHDKFRASAVDDGALEDFFSLGRQHVEEVWRVFETKLGREFRPDASIDYGCGVGRMLFPMASRSTRAIGVDIASGMLRAAREFAAEKGVENADFQHADDFLADGAAEYDVVHSYIVLQHIKPELGYDVIEKLVTRLRPGGLGMLHVSYHDPSPAAKKVVSTIYRTLPAVYSLRAKLTKGAGPLIPMHDYDIAKVERILAGHGCEVFHTQETDHSYLGRMFYFHKT